MAWQHNNPQGAKNNESRLSSILPINMLISLLIKIFEQTHQSELSKQFKDNVTKQGGSNKGSKERRKVI